MINYISRSSNTTKKLGAALAAEAINRFRKTNRSLSLALVGELGSGKTTFIQGFARGLGLRRRLTSPTFLILRRYPMPKMGMRGGVSSSKNRGSLFHIDAYRIKTPHDLKGLDFKKTLSSQKSILLIEWADKIKRLIPRNAIWIYFHHGGHENERSITFKTKP